MFKKRIFLPVAVVAAVFTLILSCASGPSGQQAQRLSFGTEVSRTLGAGQEHWYSVQSPVSTRVTVYTTGNTDTYLEAYDSNNRLIAENDDGGQGYNARLEIPVEAGRTYFFKLRGYDRYDRGAYRIIATVPTAATATAPSDNWNNWRAVTLPRYILANGTWGAFQSVAWGGGAFVAITGSGEIVYSNNGAAWTAVPAGNIPTWLVFGDNQVLTLSGGNRSIAWGNPGGRGRFFFTLSISDFGVDYVELYTSPTGAEWASHGAFNSEQEWLARQERIPHINKVVWGGISGQQMFVGVGNGFTMYSADGVNANADTIPSGFNIRGLAWCGQPGQQMFIAAGVANNGAPVLLYSVNGINWDMSLEGSISLSTLGNGTVNSIVWGEQASRFVAVGENGLIAHSPDGFAWTAAASSPFGTGSINAVAWGGPAGRERFVAVGDNGRIAHSPDGLNWTAVQNSPFGTSRINDITAGGERFVAVGTDGKIAYLAF